MRKMSLILFTVCLITCLFAACQKDELPEESGVSHEGLVEFYAEPLTFYSLDDFVRAMAEAGAVKFYYQPPEVLTEITLDRITVTERYVCQYYLLDKLSLKDSLTPDEEEMARISNTVKLEWVRNAEGNELLQNTVKQLNLKEAEKGIYYFDITYPTAPDKVLAKSIYWVRDGYMFNLDIPQSMYETLYSTNKSVRVFTEVVKTDVN